MYHKLISLDLVVYHTVCIISLEGAGIREVLLYRKEQVSGKCKTNVLTSRV